MKGRGRHRRLRHRTCYAAAILSIVLPAALLLAAAGNLAAEEAEEPAGKAAFITHKCNLCHSVPAAEITAKTKSDKMKGADLGGEIETELEALAAYLRKESELDGKSHKREFKGTDEELQAIVDWLGTLEAEAETGSDSPGDG